MLTLKVERRNGDFEFYESSFIKYNYCDNSFDMKGCDVTPNLLDNESAYVTNESGKTVQTIRSNLQCAKSMVQIRK